MIILIMLDDFCHFCRSFLFFWHFLPDFHYFNRNLLLKGRVEKRIFTFQSILNRLSLALTIHLPNRFDPMNYTQNVHPDGTLLSGTRHFQVRVFHLISINTSITNVA